MSEERYIDDREFVLNMGRFFRDFIGDSKGILREQMTLLVKTLVKWTPPENKKRGRATINQDVDKLATFVYPEHFDLVELRKDAERSKDGKAWRFWKGKLTDIGLRQIDTDGSKMAADHERFRDRRGRVRSGSNIVTSARVGKKFRSKLWAHVGNVKRGWQGAADALGFSLPAWVLKSSGGSSGAASGYFQNNLEDDDPFLIACNNTPYIRDEGMLERAMKVRERDFERWLKLRLKKRADEASAA